MTTDKTADKIIIYSTPTCPYCKMAKDFFKKNGVDYNEIDVATDAAKQEELFKKSGQMGVPVILINKQAIVGFDQAKLKKTLGLK